MKGVYHRAMAAMSVRRCVVGFLLTIGGLVGTQCSFASETSLAQMKWQRRVLLVFAPGKSDARLLAEEHELSNWRGAGDRDVSVVRIEGDRVTGSSDTAAHLRELFGVEPSAFYVVLIGKDGHPALRSATEVSGGQLEQVIDAMPMRRSGQR